MAEFIEQFNSDEWEVETPSGWQSFSGIAKTIKYTEWVVTTESGKFLICADKHIFIDKNWNEIFCDELIVGDYIQTSTGIDKISSIEITSDESNMYDLLNVQNGSIYYTNNIVSHNSSVVVAYLLHYAIFNDNVNIALLANKAQTARDLLGRLQIGYENLPRWLQQGICSWNKGSLELENGSKIFAASTSASSVRGNTYNIIYLDEFAFVPNQVADSFFSSVYPTITSGQSSKVIITSTPHGLNLFYKLWSEAIKKENSYTPIEVHWTDIPGRDENFKQTTIANTSESQWRQEFESVSYETCLNTQLGGIMVDIQIGKLYELLADEN